MADVVETPTEVETKIVRQVTIKPGEIDRILIEHARKQAGMCKLDDSMDKSERHEVVWPTTILSGRTGDRAATVVISADPPKPRVRKEDL